MSTCNDKSTTFLKNLGFNVVRYPSAGILPLGLLGRQHGSTTLLGTLDQLITESKSPLPAITIDVPSATVNGQSTSTFKSGLGLSILSNLIGAMGGTLGVSVNFTNADTITFTYDGVLEDWALPLDIGNYLRDGKVDAGNLILAQYVQGNGELYIISKIVKSKKFSVAFKKENGTEAKVDIPVIKGVIGGNISVSADNANASTVSFDGAVPLTFGFQCLSVGIEDGVLSLTTSPAGNIALMCSIDEVGQLFQPEILNSKGLLWIDPS